MNYDDILVELGELGKWQLLVMALVWLVGIASGIVTMTYSFTGKFEGLVDDFQDLGKDFRFGAERIHLQPFKVRK